MMEINNIGNSNLELNRQLKTSKGSAKAGSAKGASTSKNSASAESSAANLSGAASADQTRSQRIEQLKAQFQAGKPIDVQQLADKLVQSGMFFNKKA